MWILNRLICENRLIRSQAVVIVNTPRVEFYKNSIREVCLAIEALIKQQLLRTKLRECRG